MPAPLRILLAIRSLELAGAERQCVLAAVGLKDRGHHVAVLVADGDGPLRGLLDRAGVQVLQHPRRNKWNLPGLVYDYVAAARRHRAEVVYSFMAGSNVPAVLAKPFHKAAVVWGIRSGFMDLRRYSRGSRLVHQVARHLAPRADAIIANSHDGRRYHLQQGFRSAKFEVVENGIDADLFRRRTDTRDALRAEWGIGAQEPLIGCVARIDPMKDHPTLLQALVRLPDVRLVCVGGGPPQATDALRKEAQLLGVADRVIWAGPTNRPESVYSAFDIATLASYGEGFPNAVAEAMACGVPCVVTAAGDAASIVGDPALTVPPRQPESLAAAWQHALDRVAQDREGEARRARQRILEHFSVARMVQRTEEILRSAVAGI